MATLKLIPVDDAVIFPGMPVTMPANVGDETRVLLVPMHDNVYAKVGVVAEVSERRRKSVSFLALHRGVPGVAQTGDSGDLRVEVTEHQDVAPPANLTLELEREYRAVVAEILELRGDDGRISAFVRSITDPGALADTAGYSPDLNVGQKIQILETLDIVERLKLSLQFQQERLAELRVRKRIREDVETGAQKQQREYFLRRQMDAIRKELGENEESIAGEYRDANGHIVVTIFRQGSQLFERNPQGDLFELAAETPSVFFYPNGSTLTRLIFERDADGRIISALYRDDRHEERWDKRATPTGH